MSEQNADSVAICICGSGMNPDTWKRIGLLLREARDLLWHNPGHALGGSTQQCPGCDLEAEIDAVLGAHNDGGVCDE